LSKFTHFAHSRLYYILDYDLHFIPEYDLYFIPEYGLYYIPEYYLHFIFEYYLHFILYFFHHIISNFDIIFNQYFLIYLCDKIGSIFLSQNSRFLSNNVASGIKGFYLIYWHYWIIQFNLGL
jgi:hypothetical protein